MLFLEATKYSQSSENNKSFALNLVLLNRIPISQNKNLKIDNVETGNTECDDKKGTLKWKVDIPVNDKSVYKFSFAVKHPNYKRVNL